MKPIEIKKGDRFGKWTVCSRDNTRTNSRCWRVRCDCGKRASVEGKRLNSGRSHGCRACGSRTTHGLFRGNVKQSVEYRAWSAMQQRCKRDPLYRNVTIDPHWLGVDGFSNFLANMGDRPSDKTSLGRLDGTGPYSRSNCCWQDASEQSNNTKNNRNITVLGVTYNVSEWARFLGCSNSTLWVRHRRGMSWEDAVLAGYYPNGVNHEIVRLKKILITHGISY